MHQERGKDPYHTQREPRKKEIRSARNNLSAHYGNQASKNMITSMPQPERTSPFRGGKSPLNRSSLPQIESQKVFRKSGMFNSTSQLEDYMSRKKKGQM